MKFLSATLQQPDTQSKSMGAYMLYLSISAEKHPSQQTNQVPKSAWYKSSKQLNLFWHVFNFYIIIINPTYISNYKKSTDYCLQLQVLLFHKTKGNKCYGFPQQHYRELTKKLSLHSSELKPKLIMGFSSSTWEAATVCWVSLPQVLPTRTLKSEQIAEQY